MNTREDEKWQLLLSHSLPAFAGEAEPPYGFVTATLGRLRSEKRQREELERVGWRALFASLATLAAVVAITAGLQLQDRNEPDPGVKSMIEMDNESVS
jgi:anti-sigma-K factor RskA